MLRRVLPVASLFLFSACLPQFRLRPGYGSYSVDGEISISAAGARAYNDFDELGLDDDRAPLGSIDLKWGVPHWTIAAISTEFEGEGTLEGEITFEGNTITAGTDVASQLGFGIVTTAMTFDFLPGSFWELGVGFGAAYIDFNASFEEIGTNTSIDTDQQAPLPLIAARAGVEFGSIELSALLSGVAVSYEDDDLSFYNFDGFAAWHFLGDRLAASLILGWRQLNAEVDYDDDDENVDLDLTISGPYLGLMVSF